MPTQLTPLRSLDVDQPMSSGHRFVSAASGLVRAGDMLCVVADDEQRMALFPADSIGVGAEAGWLVPLLPGWLPQDAKKRKKLKPDFEILATLPFDDDRGEHVLLAMGSGSKARRMRGVRISIMADGATVRAMPLDLQPLFEALAPLVPEINLEGAIVMGDRILLFNRGNMAAPETHIFETDLAFVTEGRPADVKLLRRMALPAIDGVPLSVTDACRLDDGTILLSAAAEVTDDSYADGTLVGAAIIMLDRDFGVARVEWIEPVVKVEGITAHRTVSGIELLCVTDADDPDRASMLYSAVLERA